MGRYKSLLITAVIVLLGIAAWSRISKMDEPGKLIRTGSDALAQLFEGVLK